MLWHSPVGATLNATKRRIYQDNWILIASTRSEGIYSRGVSPNFGSSGGAGRPGGGVAAAEDAVVVVVAPYPLKTAQNTRGGEKNGVDT